MIENPKKIEARRKLELWRREVERRPAPRPRLLRTTSAIRLSRWPAARCAKTRKRIASLAAGLPTQRDWLAKERARVESAEGDAKAAFDEARGLLKRELDAVRAEVKSALADKGRTAVGNAGVWGRRLVTALDALDDFTALVDKLVSNATDLAELRLALQKLDGPSGLMATFGDLLDNGDALAAAGADLAALLGPIAQLKFRLALLGVRGVAAAIGTQIAGAEAEVHRRNVARLADSLLTSRLRIDIARRALGERCR